VTTFDDLVKQVTSQLQGYTKNQDALAELVQDMASDDTTFTVSTDTVTNLSRGMVEIEDEIILVKSYDRLSGQVTVMGGVNGRGYNGTTATGHVGSAAGPTLITNDPPFPRVRVKEAINDTINAMYPDLQIYATTEITRLAPVFEYAMPAEATDVWYVTGQLVGPTQIWQPLQRWRFNPMANTTSFATGKSIEIFDFVTPGRAMRVVYGKQPTALTSNSQDFTACGYPDRVVDVVKWGACARLLPAYEAGRLQQISVESTERAPLVPTSSAAKAAAYFSQLYYQRLQEERRRQWEEIPTFQRFQS
jgi:hypothetical protein